MKTENDYLTGANAILSKISSDEGIAKQKSGGTEFIDVHDSTDIASSRPNRGTLADSAWHYRVCHRPKHAILKAQPDQRC